MNFMVLKINMASNQQPINHEGAIFSVEGFSSTLCHTNLIARQQLLLCYPKCQLSLLSDLLIRSLASLPSPPLWPSSASLGPILGPSRT